MTSIVTLSSVASAITTKAPVVAVPVEGFAPLCVDGNRIRKVLKGLQLISAEIICNGAHNRWLRITARANERVRCCYTFVAMCAVAARKILSEWADKQRAKRQRDIAAGALTPAGRKLVGLEAKQRAAKVKADKLAAIEAESADALRDARETVDDMKSKVRYSGHAVPDNRRPAILAWYQSKPARKVYSVASALKRNIIAIAGAEWKFDVRSHGCYRYDKPTSKLPAAHSAELIKAVRERVRLLAIMGEWAVQFENNAFQSRSSNNNPNAFSLELRHSYLSVVKSYEVKAILEPAPAYRNTCHPQYRKQEATRYANALRTIAVFEAAKHQEEITPCQPVSSSATLADSAATPQPAVSLITSSEPVTTTAEPCSTPSTKRHRSAVPNRATRTRRPNSPVSPANVTAVSQPSAPVNDRRYATSEELAEQLGSRNWVVARRTRNIVERYGEDVVCLTPRQYQDAETKALAARATLKASSMVVVKFRSHRMRSYGLRRAPGATGVYSLDRSTGHGAYLMTEAEAAEVMAAHYVGHSKPTMMRGPFRDLAFCWGGREPSDAQRAWMRAQCQPDDLAEAA